ncbi:chemotaxis protein CheA [Fulvivirga ligni]|uniref:chemotaxis protein CheA n=1 Tax=Fulvivirga ligni TaxID=2904246 RepID=UPI001F16B028|nr:chemotaxis protein CheA [Fulvivirga ligni]UII21786.1 chemotaxis protein CheA [Fulvivirga ligni]
MTNREKELRAIFLAETQQSYDQISSGIVNLEKSPGNEELIADIFRLLHNMKANTAAMKLDAISTLAHALENVFSAIRDKEITFQGNNTSVIFRGIDHMGYLITNINEPKLQEVDADLINQINAIIQNEPTELIKIEEEKSEFTSSKIHFSDTVSISLKRLDDLLNLVGELNTGRDLLVQFAEAANNPQVSNNISNIFRIADRIQESIMTARLVTVSSLFNKFPRIVRDIATSEGKKINLVLEGADTTIDRNVLSVISDVMIHLIRNAVIHGIESTEERAKHGKKEEGLLRIKATSEKGQVIISTTDDGRGIDPSAIKKKAVDKKLITQQKAKSLNDDEALGLLFMSGFSMASKITEFAGRGVGLDIVKNVIDSIGGDLKILSEVGKKTTFKMSLPISLSVKAALLFKVDQDHFAVPLLNLFSVHTAKQQEIHHLSGELILDYREERIPLIYLHDFLFSEEPNVNMINLRREAIDIVIVWYNNRKYGLIVDQMYRQQEIMIKPLQKPLDDSELFSGITLLSSGEICYVLDVASIAKIYEQRESTVQF